MKIALSACALAAALAAGRWRRRSSRGLQGRRRHVHAQRPLFRRPGGRRRRPGQEGRLRGLQSDGQNDMGKQISDVEDMVAKGVNLLILNPRDPEGLVAAANAATAAGVKVVVMDSSINTKANVITQVRSSNDQNGFLVGQWLAKKMQGKPIKMILLSGSQGNEVGRDRRLGVFRGLVEGQLVNDGKAGFEVLGQGWGSGRRKRA